ncbi:hypothetical protein P3X46_031026 [Hevea brasiliensis]|uniref:Uncharacterized protein n=1 Tax=Hevea brasiliensis TaxID=3981 RepID=A0ABQ9KM54_HEVBR|nr:uncharacterized protein LOC110656889 [Hevea brasiliensis]KAJ9140370.1 hypothetical protein P3X46_031026 [Hevea brasiliensis]
MTWLTDSPRKPDIAKSLWQQIFPSSVQKPAIAIPSLLLRMNGNSSYESSWADQWDNNPDVVYDSQNRKSSSSSADKYKQKVGEGLGKTKAVASTGMKKVKEGTITGFHWIKDKYHKTTQKR